MSTQKKIFIGIIILLVLAGSGMRLNNIATNDFVFYDEGYYLNHNRKFAQIVADFYPKDLGEFWKAFYAYIRFSLASGKALWFAMVDLRIFWGGMNVWFYPKVVSSFFGVMTLVLTFFFARKFYNSLTVGAIAAALLALLPSHVFYSRVGLQEAFSTFLVLGGFYLYIFPRKFGWKTFLAGILFAAAFFANYRLIMLPVLIAFAELWLSVSDGKRPNFRKYLWAILTFFSCVFLIGNIDDGQNTIITFAWMFHQTHMAESKFDLINFIFISVLSAPAGEHFVCRMFFRECVLVGSAEMEIIFPVRSFVPADGDLFFRWGKGRAVYLRCHTFYRDVYGLFVGYPMAIQDRKTPLGHRDHRGDYELRSLGQVLSSLPH